MVRELPRHLEIVGALATKLRLLELTQIVVWHHLQLVIQTSLLNRRMLHGLGLGELELREILLTH